MKNKPFDPFKNLVLDEEEKQYLADEEAGVYIPVKNLSKRIKELQQIAENTLQKTESITVRLSQPDLSEFKAKALEEGLPYQTLLSSLIHKYNTGKLVIADKGKEHYQTSKKKTNDKKSKK